MTKFGLTLSSEEHDPRRLVDMAELAEGHGFDFVSISDHFHPWVDAQGHSPFVWSVLGAIADRTSSIEVGVGVTCPTVRIHPAILAQATATCAELFEGRFTWGVGTGEALNEHILGHRWPPADLRFELLEEAVDVVRRLWSGEEVTHRGAHYTVENARIYDPAVEGAADHRVGVRTGGGQARRPHRRRPVDQLGRRRDLRLEEGQGDGPGLRPAHPVLGDTTRTTPSRRPTASGPTPACPVSSARIWPRRRCSSRRRRTSPRR